MASVAQRLKESQQKTLETILVQRIQYENRNSTQTIEIESVTQGQVLEALDSLNINKTTGTDGFKNRC